MSTTATGGQAEQMVAEELARQGYKIVELNWKTKFAEIDVVATRGGVAYFVEVKYRATDVAGDGFDYITDKKLHHMTRAAEAWVQANNWQGPYELLAASVVGEEIDIRQIV